MCQIGQLRSDASACMEYQSLKPLVYTIVTLCLALQDALGFERSNRIIWADATVRNTRFYANDNEVTLCIKASVAHSGICPVCQIAPLKPKHVL